MTRWTAVYDILMTVRLVAAFSHHVLDGRFRSFGMAGLRAVDQILVAKALSVGLMSPRRNRMNRR